MIGWVVVVVGAAAVMPVNLLRLRWDSKAAQKKMKWKTRGGLLGTASGGQTLRHRCGYVDTEDSGRPVVSFDGGIGGGRVVVTPFFGSSL